MGSSRRRLLILTVTVAVAALGAGPVYAQSEPWDPWEKMNRKFFAIEEVFDRHVFGPVAHGYGRTPSPLRKALGNFSRNLSEPVVCVNDVLQGRIGTAAKTLSRFAINSTVGLLGFIDVAKKASLPHHDNSFGTTLGRWGAGPGPYVFLPFLGPSTFRDTFGDGVDIALNPLTYTNYPHKPEVGVGKVVVDGLGQRLEAQQDLDTIRQTSTDPYATLRSFFWQNREAEVSGKPVTIETLPEFDQPETPSEAPPAGAPEEPPTPPVSELGAPPRLAVGPPADATCAVVAAPVRAEAIAAVRMPIPL